MSRKHRKKDEGPEVELPITPMLDMAFQLLTFFIFTYHPTEMEGQMALALPSGGNRDTGPVNPREQEPNDDLAPVVLRLHTQHGIETGSIVYPIEIEAAPARDTADNVRELQEKLEALRQAGRLGDKPIVRIQAEGRLKWACVVDVMDACKRAEV